MPTTHAVRGNIVSRAVTEPTTLNEQARTLEVVFASERPVDSYMPGIGNYAEILDCTPQSCDLSRFLGGAQFLKEHDRHLVVGVVESARFENRLGIAVVRFAKTALGEEEYQMAKDAIRRNYSVSYRVSELAEESEGTYRAVAWQALELSVVSVEADQNCKVRSAPNHTPKPTAMKPVTPTHAQEIHEVAEGFREINLPVSEEMVLEALDQKTPADEFRSAIIAHHKARTMGSNRTTSSSHREGGVTENRSFAARMYAEPDFQAFVQRSGKKEWTREFKDVTNLRAALTLSGSGITSLDLQQNMLQTVPMERLTVADLFAQGTTGSKKVQYLVEGAYTNTAATVAEGDEKPELELDLSDKEATVQKIAAWVRVSNEMLDDIPAAEPFVNMRLRYAVEEREELQLLAGGGTGTDLLGVLLTPNILTQAKGADTVPDAIRKAITKIQVQGKLQPTGLILHPNDWQDIELMKDANGQYLAGNVFVRNEMGQYLRVPSLWNLPIVCTSSMTENTALVGAFKPGGMIFRRKGVTVTASNSDGDNFRKNLVTILAEERLTLTINLPQAFCSVTGI